MSDLSQKSIALIIPDFNFGGEEKRVVFFANNYIDYFQNVYLFAPDGMSTKLLNPKVKHIVINVRNYKNLPSVLKIIKKEKIQFFQGHKRATTPYLLASEKFLNVKSIFNFDNIYLSYNYLCKFITPSHVVYLSDIVKNYYAPYYKKNKNITINMGGDFYENIPANKIQDLKKELRIEEKFILLSLGRLSEQKNHQKLIEALSELKNENFICLVVGDGPLEDKIKRLIEKHQLSDKVRLLGHRTDVQNLLCISDILIQSSIFEGFPNVFIEAASVGLPIIATDVGSSRTLVENNGIIVEPNNSEQLAKAIFEMMQKYSFYKEKAKVLKDSDFLKQFHKANMLKNYISYYESFT
ncbi:glycosyltransferase [Flavobacterium sp. MC2016-06]|jgi:glycosyltransferase involved in cell wall biosynthesis|uniref:glycosyltransferase n=1 Tax=Flavobacterium sp. MC2016-06 TaxID=2676308 RepID=UPI0012BA8008|nr:glycosyltransferase [Flavobacterium sp. MC2016-06]MBU3862045.1 glycosyltransferase [Flavobacterium sp. MC2016-06]